MNDEYKILRDEIESNTKYASSLFKLICIGAFATLTYTFFKPDNLNNPNVFVVIFAVLAFIALKVKSLTIGNLRISAYMEVFLESKTKEHHWETRLHHRTKSGHTIYEIPEKGLIQNLILKSIYFVLGFIMFVLYATALIKVKPPLNTLLMGLIPNLIILLILFSIAKIETGKELRDKYIAHWKQVKKELEKDVAIVKPSGLCDKCEIKA